MRYTPRLQFLLDQGVKKSIAIAKILSEVLPKPAPAEPLPEGSPLEVPAVDAPHPPSARSNIPPEDG